MRCVSMKRSLRRLCQEERPPTSNGWKKVRKTIPVSFFCKNSGTIFSTYIQQRFAQEQAHTGSKYMKSLCCQLRFHSQWSRLPITMTPPLLFHKYRFLTTKSVRIKFVALKVQTEKRKIEKYIAYFCFKTEFVCHYFTSAHSAKRCDSLTFSVFLRLHHS